MAQTSSTEKPREPRPRALRMTLVARRAEIKRESQDVIDMVAPPSDRVDEYENESGFWVELRDRENRVLYRRVLHDPLNLHIEAPSGDPERPFTNIENKKGDAIFSVIAPYLEDAETLVFFGSPAGDRVAPAKPIARFDLQPPQKHEKEVE